MRARHVGPGRFASCMGDTDNHTVESQTASTETMRIGGYSPSSLHRSASPLRLPDVPEHRFRLTPLLLWCPLDDLPLRPAQKYDVAQRTALALPRAQMRALVRARKGKVAGVWSGQGETEASRGG